MSDQDSFHFLDTIDSTNVEIKRRFLSEEGLNDADFLIAKTQTGGQGRQGREWSSPEGNLYYSELRIIESYKDVNAYAFITALSAFDTASFFIQKATKDILPLMIKWPNDILWNGDKLAGILLETEKHPQTKAIGLVIGVGMNVLEAPEVKDRQLESLNTIMKDGQAPTPERVAKRLHRYIQTWIDIYNEKGLATILQAWRQRSHNIGDIIRAKHGTSENTIEGTFSGLTSSGALQIETKTGTETIYAGDIFLVAQKEKQKAS